MRETFHSYRGKLVENTKNLLTRPSAEQTREDKEIAANSLQSKSGTPQGKADQHAHLAEEKREKRCIPFVALALVLVLTSLCTLPLLKLPPTALADKMLALDATSTPTIPEAAPQDQSVQFLQGESNEQLSQGSGYDPKNCSHPYHTDTGDSLCWNEMDFTWADRDITCLYNAMHGAGQPWNVNMVDKNDKSLNISLKKATLNQNTCTDNSDCRSDNASRNDQTDTSAVHDQIGGDDIICANKQCLTDLTGNDGECGDKGGPQKQYDRFACQATSDTTSILQDTNPNTPPASEPSANYREKRWWWAQGVYINPSAYDPNGALYLPTSNLRAADIEPDSTLYEPISVNGPNADEPLDHMPKCDASYNWSCPNQASIIIYQYNGSVAKDTKDTDGRYVEVVPQPHYSPAQVDENVSIPGNPSVGKAWRPGSADVPVYWVVCGAQGGWAFPCSDPNSSTNMPFITPDNNSQSLSGNQVAEGIIVKDWLSGDTSPTADKYPVPSYTPPTTTSATPPPPPPPPPPEPGHLVYTYLNDTVYQPGIQMLFPIMLGAGFVLITPVLVLIGYQFLWSSWTLGRANAMEAFGRIILSISAIAISYEVAAMLITLTNTFNTAIVNFHMEHGYPSITIDNQASIFTLQGQGEHDPASFRGIVIPITRWGCVANDFVALLSNKFWTDAAGFVPFVGGIAKFIANIFNAIDVAKHIGEFITLILTIMLCTQVFMRVVLLNYYILTGPLAFGCWGLPGGVGQKVVSSWARGFVSLLFAQTAQIFVLATFPLILPPFPTFPSDRFGLLDVLFQALPRILVLAATIKVPTVMGTGATKAMAQAGTVVGGAVAAAGAAAMNVV